MHPSHTAEIYKERKYCCWQMSFQCRSVENGGLEVQEKHWVWRAHCQCNWIWNDYLYQAKLKYAWSVVKWDRHTNCQRDQETIWFIRQARWYQLSDEMRYSHKISIAKYWESVVDIIHRHEAPSWTRSNSQPGSEWDTLHSSILNQIQSRQGVNEGTAPLRYTQLQRDRCCLSITCPLCVSFSLQWHMAKVYNWWDVERQKSHFSIRKWAGSCEFHAFLKVGKIIKVVRIPSCPTRQVTPHIR